MKQSFIVFMSLQFMSSLLMCSTFGIHFLLQLTVFLPRYPTVWKKDDKLAHGLNRPLEVSQNRMAYTMGPPKTLLL